MLISLDWLKQYIALDINTDIITNLLTFSGIEVENLTIYGELPENIVTAKIIECELMKDSDHLFVCQVDTGKDIYQVVCGAPNCKQGIIGALALPGANLVGFSIKSTHIRGVESNGMLCSEKELGLSDDHSGIMILPSETLLGATLKSILELPDSIFELEITPNRPDLLGYIGIARDLSACVDGEIVIPDVSDIDKSGLNTEPITSNLSLFVEEPNLCSRYTARVIKNIKVTESPIWLKQRLIKAGFRPINNIVDITNFVMLEIGHPLHAFDYDKLAKIEEKPVVKVRKAEDNEKFIALDGKTYSLDVETLVIADAGKPIAIAGIIGGTNSHITYDTVNIVLESACFNHSSIRKTAYSYKISTDSSYRFERHLAPETTEYASARAAQLILDLAGGQLCSGSLDVWHNPNPPVYVPIRPARFHQVIGLKLDKEQIIGYLVKLGLTYSGEGQIEWKDLDGTDLSSKLAAVKDNPLLAEKKHIRDLTVSSAEASMAALYFKIPPYRVDLTREADLIEEVIRLHGMDKVPQRSDISLVMDRHAFKQKRRAADYLVLNGFHEVVNLSFTEPGLIKDFNLKDGDTRLTQIELLNPQNSNLSVMRTFLLPQLLQNVSYNINRGEHRLMLFELNKVFLENDSLPKNEAYRLSFVCSGIKNTNHWRNKSTLVDFYDVKGWVEGLLRHLGIEAFSSDTSVSGYLVDVNSQSIMASDCLVAEYGLLTPSIAAKFDLDTVDLKQDVWIGDIDLNKIIEITKHFRPSYIPIPIFPSVERDISFLIKSYVTQAQIADTISHSEGVSINQLCLIDEYKGKQVPEGFRSLTYRIIFNKPEKTLTDDEVESFLDIIVKNLKSKWDIQQR